MRRDMVLILDFGGSQAQSLARRVRGSGVYCEILPCDAPVEAMKNAQLRGVLTAGGEPGSERTCDPAVWSLGVPVLALGESSRVMISQLGGKVIGEAMSGSVLQMSVDNSRLFDGFSTFERYIKRLDAVELPEGFRAVAYGDGMTVAFSREARMLYGIQFDIESNDPEGLAILNNFLAGICSCERWWSIEAFAEQAIERIRAQVGEGRALMALSGGVDSSVCAVLMNRAIGAQLHCIYVDTGLMRKGDTEMVRRVFSDQLGVRITIVDAKERFLKALSGVTDPEEKWRAVSEEFAAVYDEEAAKLPSVDYMVQGTIYPDVLHGFESGYLTPAEDEAAPLSVKALIEPLRELFKDEVRELGETLNLPKEIVGRQSLPGAGLGIRIIGEVTAEKLNVLREADAILHEEILAANLDRRVRHFFAVLCETASGGARHCSQVIALRAVGAAGADFTAYRTPYDLLERVTERILTTLPTVDRVVYDLTTTPPRPIEWE